ncbi:MAG: tetratricopeptide repeat protein, partial [Anaerolineales bacterium]|nr:tetratricopeptide repeat protein [Anaerolineales bacterium]
MIQIALSEYLAEIDQLIEDQRFVESIAHCRHILQQHPRHVGTYRMLGKALLEQQNYHDAADVFQRVLSADPEDFIAHVGMSIISKEDTLLPQAVWHMERAHEMDPYNLVIRDELLALYEQRDERLPKTLTLSRSALARLYARSEMYLLAAAELRQLLAEDENRMDLMTLLAETLWQAGQRVDAVDVCLEILERLPNSIKANAILAEVWLTTGRGEEANEFIDALSRLTLPERTTIDDNGLVATVYSTEGAPSLPQQQMVDYLDYVPEAEGSTEDIVPQWVDELNLVDESAMADPDAAIVDDIPTPLPLTDVPSWFNDLGDEVQPTEEPASETSLDWLRDVAVSRAEPVADNELVGLDESYSAPDSQGNIVDEVMASSPAEDIPDWLGGILEEQDGDSLLDSLVGPDRDMPEAEELPLLPDAEPDDSAWNDWDEVDIPALADDSVDDLTWLHEDTAEDDQPVDGDGEEFTWLENSASPVVDVSAADEEDFDWLDAELDNQQDPAPAEPIPAAADLDDFDWLEDGDPALPPAEEPAAALAPADSADNLLDLDDLPDMAEEWTLSGSEEHFMDLHDKPGNEDEELSSESESSSPTAQQPEDGALDWLQDLADAEPTHTGLLRSVSDDEPLPDWLSQDIADGSLAKELPDWLAEDSLVSGSDLSATVTDHEMIIPDVDRGTGDLSQVVLPETPIDSLDEIVEDEDVSEDLSWLDAMSPVDEPPTLSWADSGVTPVPTEEPPTPPAAQHVPELLPEPEPSDDEMSLFDNWQDDTVRMSAEEFAALQKAAGVGAEDESPSDAEIAMDWLDELSEAPEMDMDAEPMMAPETEIMASSDPELSMAPEDEAEAMDWLEDLSAEFEIDAGVTDLSEVSDDLDLFEESLEPPSSGELTWLDELSQPVVDEETGETLLGPDDGSVAASGETVSAKDLDSAEVMAWLDELAELPENEEPGTVVDDDLLPDLLGSAVELPVAEVEVTQEEDSDAMAWLDQLATEFADEETGDTAMATDIDDLLAETPEPEADIVEMQMAAPEPPQVIVDGQVVPDLDIEPTEDPLSEADAMA